MGRALFEGFLDSAGRYPDRIALQIGDTKYAYAALRERVLRIAATLQARRSGEGSPLTCVLGQRTLAGFAGILGALCSGHGYVPMLPTYPAGRLANMISRSECRAIVVDEGAMKVLPDVLARLETPMLVLSPDDDYPEAVKAQAERHTLLGPADLAAAADWTRPTVTGDDIAYLLFTSGSTGQPKGVMVAHRNIERFLDVVVERYDLTCEDRFSHMFEVTFDLSLFDLFGAWQVGGQLCCPDARQRLLPAHFVNDAGITVWFSVPSTALLMHQTRTLVEGAFPSLRWSLFCGEALTVSVAEAFAKAAPNSVVENLYGPTELTLACTLHTCDQATWALGESAVVPIGEPFPGMRAMVVSETLEEVAPGESGELILTGPQVALGYWRDEEKTKVAFTVPPGETETFYRTGDRAVRPAREGEPMQFLGRMDSQVKIRGYRVELGEIEAVLREEAGVGAAVAIAWPPAPGGTAAGVVAFFDDDSIDKKALLTAISDKLPRYMVPREVRFVDAFPLNVNGKIDRKALRATLE